MPLPYRFLAGASAAARVPQLLAIASRRHLVSGASWNRRLEVGAADVAHLLEKNRFSRSYTVATSSERSEDADGTGFDTSTHGDSRFFTEGVPEEITESEEEDKHFLAALQHAKKNHSVIHSLADTVTEIRYQRWLRETHNLEFTPPADSSSDTIRTHLETVKQFLTEDVLKHLDYRVEAAVYQTEHEVEWLIKDIRETAKDATQIAFASTNRRINAGFTPVRVLFDLAPLAERKLKFQKGKDTLSFIWCPPKFEDLGIHRALKVSAAKIHRLELELNNLRHDRGLAPLPMPLRIHDARFLHNYRSRSHWRAMVGLRIPKVKQGTNRLWFQPREKSEGSWILGKNVIQAFTSNADKKLRPLVGKRKTVKITWYHKEPGASSAQPSVGYRRYSSKKAWADAHATEENLRPLKPQIHRREGSQQSDKDLSSYTGAQRIVRYHPTRNVKIERYYMDSQDSFIRLRYNARETEVAPSQVNLTQSTVNSPGTVGVKEGEAGGREPRMSYYPSEAVPGGGLKISYYVSGDTKAVAAERKQENHTDNQNIRTRFVISRGLHSPLSTPGLGRNFEQRREYSTKNLSASRSTSGRNEYNLPKLGEPLPFKRIQFGDSILRRKLQQQEIQRQESLAAIRQGKEFKVGGVEEPPEDMMEEAEFVKALTELATSTVEDITETSGMEFMDVGDLIELRSFGGSSELGVFVQPPLKKNGNFLFLTESGRMKTWPTTGMVFAIPKFASIESAELLRKYLSQISEDNDALMLDPPRHLTKPLTDKIREFQRNALNVFAQKLPIIERLYDKFSHETESRLITTHEAAKEIFPGGYDNHQFYAVHLALMDDPRHFIADRGRDHKKTTQFEIRSRKQLKVLRTVTEWLRRKSVTLAPGKEVKKPSDIVESFAKKAAALIETSRALRGDQEDLFKPVEQFPMQEFAWNENDKAIIEFLKCSLESYWFQTSPFAALYPQILKATARYKEEWKLDVDLLYIFLMEIGVYRPWENKYRFSTRMRLPYHAMSKEADALADKVAEIDKDAEIAWQKLALKDKMESFREDITETIYAIDDPSAEEIDDGISLTPISDMESWVHVHVANPTAFLEADHWITEMAKEKFQTVYLPEKTFGMIPRGLVDYKWGLASDRPTLTISVKVNHQSGDVLDYKIRYGNAKNVKRVTYTNYNTILGYTSTAKPFQLVINPPRDPKTGDIIDQTPSNPPLNISAEEATILKRLREIAVALKKKRVAAGSLSFVNESFRISINDHPLNPDASNGVDINPDIPILYKGLPTLTFTRAVPPTAAYETVAEFMLLGGTIVSRFLSTHKVPAPYRAHSITPRQSSKYIWENILLPERNEMGVIDKRILRDHFNILGSTRLQAQPDTHQLLGITADPESGIGGYTKATSPLRRFLDMVVHFQVEQAMLNLRDGLPATHNLPFSQSYLERELPMALNKERRLRDIQQQSERFWVWKLIRWGTLESKAVPGREDLMPQQYTMELTSKNFYQQASMGVLKEFGVPMKFWFKDEETWRAAEWGSLGDVAVDESLWSRIKVNMRWNKSYPVDESVPCS